jgi:hypothetical protein
LATKKVEGGRRRKKLKENKNPELFAGYFLH